MSEKTWEELEKMVKEDLPQLIEGVNLETMEDGSIKVSEAVALARKLTEKLAGLYDIKNRGFSHPDLKKIPLIEEALKSLERIDEVLPVRDKTDLRCRIGTAPARFDDFHRLFQEAEEVIRAVRLVGKAVKDESRPKGVRVEFLPEAKIPRGIPQWVWEAQIWVYDPQTKETLVYFPCNFQKEDEVIVNDDVAIAKALRDLYQRARDEHREFKDQKAAQKEAERPYFEQSTLKDLTEALVSGKDGVIAFGFNYQEQYSDKPRVRGVVVVKAEAGKLTVIDLTPSFEEIEGLVKGAEYSFTAGERPDLRRVPRPLQFMLFKVLDSIRTKAGGTETGQGKTGREEKSPPPAEMVVETKPQRRNRVKKTSTRGRDDEPSAKVSKAPKIRGGRVAAKAALRDAAEAGEDLES